MITEELKEKNFNLFLSKLEKIGVSKESFESEEISVKIKNATFALTNENDLAFDGSLLHVILRTLTPYAVKINELLPEGKRVDNDSLIKICFLHQLSKATTIVKNDNEWEIEKRGMVYKYAPSTVALKMGMKSLLLAQSLGVTFTEEEAEAMIILDRSDVDTQAKFYSGTLATIIKQAAELTYLTNRIK